MLLFELEIIGAVEEDKHSEIKCCWSEGVMMMKVMMMMMMMMMMMTTTTTTATTMTTTMTMVTRAIRLLFKRLRGYSPRKMF